MAMLISNPEFFTWLLGASLSLAILWAVYSCFFRKWTFFEINRWIILGGTGACLLLPLAAPYLPGDVVVAENTVANFRMVIAPDAAAKTGAAELVESAASAPRIVEMLFLILTIVYWTGVAVTLARSAHAFRQLRKIRSQSRLLSTGPVARIWAQRRMPTFSFGRDIYLHEQALALPPEALASVRRHEEAHVTQQHSVDNVVFELVTAVFWFNPFVRMLARHLRDLHEFLADRHVADDYRHVTDYQELLVALATGTAAHRMAHPFSDSQFLRRVIMLNKPKTKAMEGFKLLLLAPACAAAAIISACVDTHRNAPANPENAVESPVSGPVISKINWNGNKLHSDAELNELLGIKPGDRFNKNQFNERLFKGPLDKSVVSLYMDNGYLFFYTDVKEKIVDGKAEVTVDISEDEQVWVNNVTVTGKSGGKALADRVMPLVEMKNGQVFNRSLLIRSQEKVAKSGLVNPDSVMINPTPLPQKAGEKRLVDIAFVVQQP